MGGARGMGWLNVWVGLAVWGRCMGGARGMGWLDAWVGLEVWGG